MQVIGVPIDTSDSVLLILKSLELLHMYPRSYFNLHQNASQAWQCNTYAYTYSVFIDTSISVCMFYMCKTSIILWTFKNTNACFTGQQLFDSIWSDCTSAKLGPTAICWGPHACVCKYLLVSTRSHIRDPWFQSRAVSLCAVIVGRPELAIIIEIASSHVQAAV